jgi:hypothetical protein
LFAYDAVSDVHTQISGITTKTPVTGNQIERYYRSFHGPLNFFNKPTTTTFNYASSDLSASGSMYVDAKEMLRPHMLFFLFEDISASASMSFTMKLTRNFEAVPTGAGEYLEKKMCQLTKYSHPLEILRNDTIRLDAMHALDLIKYALSNDDYNRTRDLIDIYGFWDKPFFEFMKKIPSKIRDVTHSDLFQHLYPVIVEAAAKRFGIPIESIH